MKRDFIEIFASTWRIAQVSINLHQISTIIPESFLAYNIFLNDQWWFLKDMTGFNLI